MGHPEDHRRSAPGAPLLSACLIVRDEEKNLQACFDSMDRLAPTLAEVCVYDTGSVDGTVELCRARGAKVVEGFWDGDFGRARNEALSLATAAWALIIDADEEVIANGAVLSRLLNDPQAGQIDVFNAPLTHVDDSGRTIGHSSYGALLRISEVQYVGKIHEVALRRDGLPTRTVDLDESVLTFRHTGYATPAIRRAKAERNAAAAAVDLAQARQACDRQRLGEAYYHSARSILRLGNEEEALNQLLAAWECFENGSLGRDRTLRHLVPLMVKCGDQDAALRLIGRYYEADGAPELVRLLLAQLALNTGRPGEALAALDTIPDAGNETREVHPRDVLALRIRTLDALQRHDEALACCLVLVARYGDLSRVGELLARAEGQSGPALAALLDIPPGAPWRLGLVSELRHGGPLGVAVAQALLTHGRSAEPAGRAP